MRIKDEYKKSGYFWLPEKPEHKIPGTLTISDGGKIELEVVGLFNDDIAEIFNMDADNLSRIIGHVEKDGFITLENCFYTNKNMSLNVGIIAKSQIYARYMFSGVAYDKDEEVTFNTLSFSVEHMDEWIRISGIKSAFDYENHAVAITYSKPNSISYRLNNGMTLGINFSYSLPFSKLTEAKVIQKTYFKLSSENARILSDFTLVAYRLTNFLCFAMNSTVSLQDVTATSNEIFQTINEKQTPIAIGIYYESIPFLEKEPIVKLHDMVFSFNIIQDNAEDIFNNWINAYDLLAPALGLYFSTKLNAYKYLESKFLALVQGLETYHRRTSDETLMNKEEFNELINSIMQNCPTEKHEWLEGRLRYGNEISLRNRINKTIEPFKKHIGNSEDRCAMVKKIVDTRNYYAHYDEKLDRLAAKGKNLWALCEKMEVIFQLHLLKVIGFTENEIDSVISNSHDINKKLDIQN